MDDINKIKKSFFLLYYTHLIQDRTLFQQLHVCTQHMPALKRFIKT